MASIDVSSLEPNSHKYRAEKAAEQQKERERLKPIVSKDSVVSTKKPMSKKFTETFLTEDSKDIKSWLLLDIIIPGIKNTILDILSMMFFGETASRSRKSSGSKKSTSRFNYRSCYDDDDDRERIRRRRKYYSDDRVDFRNIVLKNRSDAEEIVDELRKRIHDYDSVSVADLLDLVDIPGRYTDNNWGWDDERDIGIRRISSGYLIDVGEPKYLE